MMLGDAVYPDKVGGSWRFLHDMAEGLSSRGHRVDVLVPKASPGLPERQLLDGFTLWRYGGGDKSSLSQLRLAMALRRLMQDLGKEQWDLINYHFAWPAAASIPMPEASLMSVPLVYTFQGPWCEEYIATLRGSGVKPWQNARVQVSYRLRRAMEGRILRRCRHVMVLSNFSRETMRRIHGPGLNVTVMKGGIKPESTAVHLTRYEARRRLGLVADGRIVFTVRRLSPRMGLDLLIESMMLLHRRLPDARLIIGGRGESQSELQRLISGHGLDSIARLEGFIPEEKLALYLRASDLVVMPSLELEGFGLVSLQAMMNGTPVMGTPIGGNRELIGSLDSRLLFRGLTPGALADGMVNFFSHRDNYPSSEDVLDFYTHNYDWDIVLDDWESAMKAIAVSSSTE
ncbi:MAG: glycosyltransferase family 4 protein [bacterium]|nr:glycosyltransferase family 4 protein [bacterium]